jgi:hypothetical protein
MALAKESGMAGIAVSLVIGSLGGGPSRRKRKRAKAKIKAKVQAAAAKPTQRAVRAAKDVRKAA